MARLPFSPEELAKLVKESEKKILAKICQMCHMGVLKPHHEKPNLWMKCEICGWTKQI